MDDEDDEPPTRRGGLRLGWVLAAVATAAAVGVAVFLTVQPDGKKPGDFAKDVADALTAGGDQRFQSVFCELAPERGSGVDVFALVRPIKVTVVTVAEKDDTHARALLAVGKMDDRVFIWMEKQSDWCVSAIVMCATAARGTSSPPRLSCDGLLGRD